MAELLAFTTDHVCRLTRLTPRQVRYWDETGFFSPTVVHGLRRAFGRIYSFRDVVGLRTIAILRKKVPLQELRRIGEWLLQHHQTPWSSLRLGLAGKKVIFFDPDSGVAVEARGGEQTVFAIALEPIANEMHQAAERLKERTSEDHGQIVRHRNVVHNAFTLAGTRVPTEAVWEFHQAGYKSDAIIKEFPRLTKKDVKAAILFERKRKAA
jgi:DNA-binding transcriptional MerR regulator